MKQIISILLFLCTLPLQAQSIQYTQEDSALVVSLLQQAQEDKPENLMLYFGRKFIGVPYVAKTLERNKTERLVVNLHELDCTTYVEQVLALTLCARTGKQTFQSFCSYLRQIRYEQGRVGYGNRQHYFTLWILDNERQGFVKEIHGPNPPFTAKQKVRVYFMTRHPEYYPMMQGNKQVMAEIRSIERRISGKVFPFIPKASIANTELFRGTIHDGDILCMLTRKDGLDTTHIGLAVWQSDGLHLLNASALRKKVVEERLTLYQYMQSQRLQTGIRVVRLTL